jgi:hypothetical protein
MWIKRGGRRLSRGWDYAWPWLAGVVVVAGIVMVVIVMAGIA